MKANVAYWPTAIAFLIAVAMVGAPFNLATAGVLGVLTVFWAVAGWRLQHSWSDAVDSVRMVHLTLGALLISTFVLLVSVEITGASGTVVVQGTLMLVGPLMLFLGHSLFRVARHGQGRLLRDDLLDTVAYLLLPLALTVTVTWPSLSEADVGFDSRLIAISMGVLASVVFAGGIVIIVGRPTDGPALTFVALAAITLGLLGWLAMITWIRGEDLGAFFPRLLVVPGVFYLLAVDRGEPQSLPPLAGLSQARHEHAVSNRHQRWVVYAGVGLSTVFLAVVASDVVPIIFAAFVGGLAIVRLALLSTRVVRSNSIIGLFDNLMADLPGAPTADVALEHSSIVARALLGPDADVGIAGRAYDGEDQEPVAGPAGPAGPQRACAVLSRHGGVQVRSSSVVSAEQIRAVRYLANLTELVLNSPKGDPRSESIDSDRSGDGQTADRVDRHSGLPNLHDFELQDQLNGVIVTVFYLHDLERLRDSISPEAGDSFVRRLVARAQRSFRDGSDRVWRGDGSKLIVMSSIESREVAGSGRLTTDHLDTSDRLTSDHLDTGDHVRSDHVNSAHRIWIEARRVSLSSPTALGMSFVAPIISAGFTVVDRPTPATEALQQAEMALMYARDNKPRSTVEYTSELHARMAREWKIESYLAASLNDLGDAGFSVHYQPIIESSTGLVRVVEGLCRWNHPELGSVSPSEFIPIAERAGVVSTIDEYVLVQAIEDVDHFRSVDPNLIIQVNMSPTGLEAGRLSETAKTILRHLGGDNPGITLEITESALTHHPIAELSEVFSFLREGNIGISLDDFGTGESNFERLGRLPFTQVKLANDFVRSNDEVLVANVVQIVHDLGMTCVVEGVETMAQYEVAVAGGGDLLQGWIFAKAMPRDEALHYILVRQESLLSEIVGDGATAALALDRLNNHPSGSGLGVSQKTALFGLHEPPGDGNQSKSHK